jgi:Fe2+ or Zn2+ uptake regulation protein
MENETVARRNTHQRALVLNIVRENLDHPTADEIYKIARERDPVISKGTVYRNLKLLADICEIRKLPMPIGPDHYDFNMDNHYHFICRSCYRVVDADIPYQEELNSAGTNMPDYITEWHRLILVGLCPECSKKTD